MIEYWLQNNLTYECPVSLMYISNKAVSFTVPVTYVQRRQRVRKSGGGGGGGGTSCTRCKNLGPINYSQGGIFLTHGVAEHVGLFYCLCCPPGVLADHPSQREEVTMIVALYPGLKTMHQPQSMNEST